MSDQEMIEYIRSLRPRLETRRGRRSRRCCTHSSRQTHIDHTHPDAAIALTRHSKWPRGRGERVGDEALWIPWKRPGFALAKEHRRRDRRASCGSSRPAREARLITGVRRVTRHTPRRWSSRSGAADALARSLRRCRHPRRRSGCHRSSEGRGRRVARRCAPRPPRPAVLADRRGVVLEVDRSDEARFFRIVAPRPDREQDRLAVPRPPDQQRSTSRSRSSSTQTMKTPRGLATKPPRRGRGLFGVVPRVLRTQHDG